MDDAVLDAVGLSLRVATIATLLVTPVAAMIAYWLSRTENRLRPLVETLVALPLVLPPSAVGYAFLVLLGRDGPLSPQFLGIDLDLLFTWKGAVVAAAVMALPLVVRTARLAFDGVDPRLELMGASLGLSRPRVLWQVTLPMARSGLYAAALIGFSRALGEFGATVLIAREHSGSDADSSPGPLSEHPDRARRPGDGSHADRDCPVFLRGLRGGAAPERSANASDRGTRASMNRTASPLAFRLRRRFAGFELDVDVEMHGRALGLFGPSGCGKTTILETLLGWRRVDEGSIRLGDRILSDSSTRVDLPSSRRALGIRPPGPPALPPSIGDGQSAVRLTATRLRFAPGCRPRARPPRTRILA